ncbi:uncharacterized protein LOC133315767 [Gastrolobium bilobum]|uniref:uncharacterized protein LOC133315767 n=1 Tax=Gastrolobium bilobum TaxID=150636 RepID=UPI002AB1A3E6|nr:uncharacterized protein LOC133315767 [Gastrolobium bilobum]
MKMGTRRKKSEESSDFKDGDTESEGSKRAKKESDFSHYEQIRDQRIKENMERMQKLGLLDLSLKLKHQKKNSHDKKKMKALPPSQSPSRRSSRLLSVAPVDYNERHSSIKEEKEEKEVKIFIPEGRNPEVYTEEHEKLLGDCETIWELYVDGYDEDGERIYDAVKGESCHQCRQKTLCQHTSCNKCELSQGQLCGDCLYTRYGENVIEANHDPKWTCPACRGICNCSRCRREEGWMPTSNIYRKVTKLGFKSVAHYLIKTRRSEICEGSGAENIVAEEELSETSADTTVNTPVRTRRSLRS